MLKRIFILAFMLVSLAQYASAQTQTPIKAVWTNDQRFQMNEMPKPGQQVILELPDGIVKPGFDWTSAIRESSGELVEFSHKGDGKTIVMDIHAEGRKDYKLEDWNLFLTKIVGKNYIQQ